MAMHPGVWNADKVADGHGDTDRKDNAHQDFNKPGHAMTGLSQV